MRLRPEIFNRIGAPSSSGIKLIPSDCVAAINAFIEEFTPSGLVVCCRLDEYRWLPKRLKLNGAICIEPLSPEEVRYYLAAGGPILTKLREAVGADLALQELGQTPLMLAVMSLAYQGAGGGMLSAQSGDSIGERRRQILRLYVQEMFQRKVAISPIFANEEIIGWLSWLARKMKEDSQSVFLVEGLQPSGVFIITDRGKKVLTRNPPKIDLKLLEQFPKFLVFKAKLKTVEEGYLAQTTPAAIETPLESLEAAYAKIRGELKSELLDRLKAEAPVVF
jgi:hypothetical protein